MKKVLIAISDSFPYGAAYAVRTRALCKLFHQIGYETVVLCDYPSKEGITDEYGKIVSVAQEEYKGLSKLVKLPIDYNKKLHELLNKEQYEFVVARSMFDRFDLILHTVKKCGVPLILESCEWYDVKGFARGKYDIRYLQFNHCFRNSYNKVDGVIAISRLLEEHYASKGIKVVRIPGIHEIDKLKYRSDIGSKRVVDFLFAGNIYGGKELFDDFIVALAENDNSISRSRLNVYGPSKESVEAGLSKNGQCALKELGDRVIFHGMVPQYEMAKVCAENDFGIFFRPDRRSSHAGFPTKLGEYLAAGTPVITNNTGDIADILVDGKNGFLLSGNDYTEISEAIKRCLDMDVQTYTNMRFEARKTATNMLDYRVYGSRMIDFLNSIYHVGG